MSSILNLLFRSAKGRNRILDRSNGGYNKRLLVLLFPVRGLVEDVHHPPQAAVVLSVKPKREPVQVMRLWLLLLLGEDGASLDLALGQHVPELRVEPVQKIIVHRSLKADDKAPVDEAGRVVVPVKALNLPHRDLDAVGDPK